MIKIDNITEVFKALSDEKRFEILNLLSDGEKCACVLLDKLELTQSGLSYHMKIMCDAGIINSRPVGKWVYYSINKEGLKKISLMLLEYI